MTAYRCFRCGWSAPDGAPTEHQCRNPFSAWVQLVHAIEGVAEQLREDERHDGYTMAMCAEWGAAAVNQYFALPAERLATAERQARVLANHPALFEADS